ncbi:hypothetical protein [Proteiniphilum sp. UBA1028]|jgi:Spy/CpxP family protein refolding chaperone|uniref:hypothetical protein n=1 Tax=Proteiniphilum sp. UBA1028 TaxID=1947251 RepID=UPI0025D528AD|nr:hypothetical protein [Proteiniphilum sp. UBA1028]
MKRVVLMAMAVIFTTSFSLMAQQNSGRQGQRASEMRWTAKERAESMAKQLDLTADQTAKVQALFEKQDAKRAEQVAKQREKRDELQQDREKRRAEMQELRNKTLAENDAELEQIIGKEKMAQWKTYRDERMKTMRDTNRQGRRN